MTTAPIKTTAQMADPDGFYEQLVEAHDGLSHDEGLDLVTRLMLLLANQIGDSAILHGCVAAARDSVLGARPLTAAQG